jgi:Zn-dependent protease with chaperone function
MFFNPVVQVVARTVVRETEARADDLAVAATGDPLALASGLVKLFRTAEGGRDSCRRRRIPWVALLPGPLARARAKAIEERCRRLLDQGPSGGPVPLGRVRLAMTGFALLLLLFFVV